MPNATVSILPMGSLFEQTLGTLFELVVVQLMREMNITAKEMFERYANLE